MKTIQCSKSANNNLYFPQTLTKRKRRINICSNWYVILLEIPLLRPINLCSWNTHLFRCFLSSLTIDIQNVARANDNVPRLIQHVDVLIWLCLNNWKLIEIKPQINAQMQNVILYCRRWVAMSFTTVLTRSLYEIEFNAGKKKQWFLFCCCWLIGL